MTAEALEPIDVLAEMVREHCATAGKSRAAWWLRWWRASAIERAGMESLILCPEGDSPVL